MFARVKIKEKYKGGQKIKKIILIVLLCLLPLCLFAEPYQTSSVVIRTTVSRITLSDAATNLYKLYGGFGIGDSISFESLLADDISKNDITVYFRIAQEAKTRTDETIDISVEAECFLNTEQFIDKQYADMLTASTNPIISNVTCLSSDVLKVNYYSTDQNKVVFHLDYSMGKPIENVNLTLFAITWKKTEGLAPGLYTSKIVLSYTLN